MSVALLAVDPAIPLHCVCYSITFPFYFLLPMSLRADAPAVPAHFFINILLKASMAHFPHLYLFWALLANIPVVSAHFIPRAYLAHYFFFTSFTPMGFLLYPLSFLDPITTSLSLIYFSGLLAFKSSQ